MLPVMATIPCDGCGQRFKSDNALSNHQRKCSRVQSSSSSLIQLAARVKRRRVENSAPAPPPRAPSPPPPLPELPDFQDVEMHPPEPEPEIQSGKRVRKAPARFKNFTISSLASSFREAVRNATTREPTPSPPPSAAPASPPRVPSPSPPPVVPRTYVRTEPNEHGLFRIYDTKLPSQCPDLDLSAANVVDTPTIDTGERIDMSYRAERIAAAMGVPDSQEAERPFYEPFRNASTFRLINWAKDIHTLTDDGVNTLVEDVLTKPDFDPADLADFDARTEKKRLDRHIADNAAKEEALPFGSNNIWKKDKVRIPMPCKGHRFEKEEDAPHLELEFWRRDLLGVLKSAVEGDTFSEYHLKAFKLFMQQPDSERITRVYGESYTSDRAIDTERTRTESQEEDELEKVLLWLILFSDATHLTNFGTAELWPIYLWIANQSKYPRALPKNFSALHLAYLPKIPDLIKAQYRGHYGCDPSDEVLRLLNRAVIQAVYDKILSPDFVKAYKEGIVFKCSDGKLRRFLPEFFAYSADYVEKVTIVCIKFLGSCPCVRCKVQKSKVFMMGSVRDMRFRVDHRRVDTPERQDLVKQARKKIFQKGQTVNSNAVKNLLDPLSLTAVENSFSKHLLPLGFDVYELLVVDLLHEFEIGVWKAILIHLVRLLYSSGPSKVTELDYRFRQTPTYGRSVIRRFHNNVSDMKKLAARDFEDILQAYAEFDRLVQDLLFTLATWHAYAKLRMVTDSEIDSLEQVTRLLGQLIRKFTNDSFKYDTKETPAEVRRRKRRAADKLSKGEAAQADDNAGARSRKFNMETAKLHFLGDYAESLRKYGTTDGYSSTIGEVSHKLVKSFYEKTNKNQFEGQIAKHDQRARELRRISGREPTSALTSKKHQMKELLDEPLQLMGADDTVQVSTGQRNRRLLSDFDYDEDEALKDFVPKLRAHLFGRFLSSHFPDLEVNDDLERKFEIRGDCIYEHAKIRINYLTYDLRKDVDSVNPANHADIMTLSSAAEDDESEHPYMYGRVCGVYHANVRLWGDPKKSRGNKLATLPFIWVRWYELDNSGRYRSGFKAKRLHRLRFCLPDDPLAFEFLDPHCVIRAVHLIPCFKSGMDERRNMLDAESLARRQKSRNAAGEKVVETKDWKYYYVNHFVDRDMFMRFRAGGVGHQQFWTYLKQFRKDAGLDDQEGRLPLYNENGEVVEPGAGYEDVQEEETQLPAGSGEDYEIDSEYESIYSQEPDSDDSDDEFIAHATV
ncbi:hypothetical protein VNI00_010884 [Paramarasmius palmivorus]|uniref:C2H2-type domain-containing protein n=1 Tax=Paramarasmius palmivorus TaxID=297713 RepID=A0AAW0CDG4_9AGAR